MGNFHSALQSFQQALKIILEKLGDNHPHTATCYEDVGNTLGDYTSALLFHKRALEIRRRTHGEKHIDIASSHCSIGIIHRRMGNCTLALQSQKQALKITRGLLGDNHPETARCYNNIGAAQETVGDYTSAINSFQQALKIAKERLGDNHPFTAKYKRNLITSQIVESVQGRATVFTLHQPELRKRHTCRMRYNPDKAISYNDSGFTEESFGLHASLLLSLQGAQLRREISGKKHSKSSTTPNRFGFIKCALVILLILMILSCSILTHLSSSEKKYI